MYFKYNYKNLIVIIISVSVIVGLVRVTTSDVPIEIIGLGWHSPQLAFSSRYFFVWHRPVTRVAITSPDTGCLVWHQVFNETQFDTNLTIVRYKLLSPVCSGLEITLFGKPDDDGVGDDGQQVLARKVVKEDVWSESCVCRRSDWPQLMKCHQMSQQFLQIDSDLSLFNTSDGIDFDVVLDEMQARFAPHNRSFSFCHYQIIDNEAYKQCYGEYVGFAQFIDEILKSLLSKTSLPDFEFVSNLGDWPLSDKRTKPALPVFSWCGSTEHNDIVIPTYELTESTLQMQGRISLDILSALGKQSMKFEDKKDVLFWRGRDSNEYRLKLVRLAMNHTDLINASLTNYFFFRDQMDELGPKSPHIPFFEFFKFKYQMNIDGTVAAYRLPYLLAGNSLVLKQESKYYEFFYNLLQPDVHYIPVHKELDDLMETLENVMQNVDKSKQMIDNSREFVLNNLLPEHIYCYHYNLFYKYSKLLAKSVQLRPQMVPIIKDTINSCNCVPNHRQKVEL